MPEIKQGKIIAGDPAELDVLTLKKRRGGKLSKFFFLFIEIKKNLYGYKYVYRYFILTLF